LFSFFFKETLQAFTPARYSLLIDLLQTFTEKTSIKKPTIFLIIGFDYLAAHFCLPSIWIISEPKSCKFLFKFLIFTFAKLIFFNDKKQVKI